MPGHSDSDDEPFFDLCNHGKESQSSKQVGSLWGTSGNTRWKIGNIGDEYDDTGDHRAVQ